MKIPLKKTPSPIKIKRLVLLLIFAVVGYTSLYAQIFPERRTNQELPSQDTTTLDQESLGVIPDSIILESYDPRFPNSRGQIKDSLLRLTYARFDPILKAGPDFVYLNSVIQPAALNPILGTPYERLRQLTQAEHPTYSNLDAPYFNQNIPFSYVAYNQGGEIDDAQVEVKLGRSFANGWKLSFQYHRTYYSGERNNYPNVDGERINLGGSLAYIPDSSRHRAYLSLVLRSRGFNSSGGYDFASDDTIAVPDAPFLATSNLTSSPRSEGRRRRVRYLHRYFLKRQADENPKGFAGALDLAYTTRDLQTNTTFTDATFAADSAFHGIYSIDNRGLRYEVKSTSVLAEADLEYFASADGDLPVAFNFRAGIYGGSQTFEALYETGSRSQFLFGLNGHIRGTVLDRFTLNANADIALGSRVGEGIIDGSISWKIANKLNLAGEVLLERSAAPLAAEVLGINSQVLQNTNLSVSTHTRVGGSANYTPLNLNIRGYLDVFADAIIYEENGIPDNTNSEVAIPTLSYDLPVSFGPLTILNRGVFRNPVQSQSVRLPGYTGQHSIFSKATIFKGSMNLIAGVDTWMRSPVRRYGYFPLTSVFILDQNASEADWQYSLDLFLAVKVQSFKAFVRIDRILVSDSEDLPATVEGYPIARPEGLIPVRSVLRLGVSFFLFN